VAIQADDGSTPLHRASEGVHVDLARFLVEHGADVAAQDKQGFTPLHSLSSTAVPADIVSFHYGERAVHVELAKFLVEHGADVAAQDEHGSTSLHLASKNGHVPVDLAQFLVEHSTITTAHATLEADQPTTI